MLASFRTLPLIAWLNLKSGLRPLPPGLFAAALMCANNLVFFVIWLIFFRRFSNLRGWTLEDVALLYGIAAWSFGSAVLLADGMREIARAIVDGSLDVHLGRPSHPLPSLLMSRSQPAGLGDMASALVLWLVFAGRGVDELPLIILIATTASVVVVASTALINMAAFWLPEAVNLAEDLFMSFLMAAVYPQHVFGPFLRMLLFTLLPAAFVGLVPVEAVREASLEKAALLLGAAMTYGALALIVFERGLKRYTSGTGSVGL